MKAVVIRDDSELCRLFLFTNQIFNMIIGRRGEDKLDWTSGLDTKGRRLCPIEDDHKGIGGDVSGLQLLS